MLELLVATIVVVVVDTFIVCSLLDRVRYCENVIDFQEHRIKKLERFDRNV